MQRKVKRSVVKREAATGRYTTQVKGAVIGVLMALMLLAVCAVLIGTSVIPETWMSGCVVLCAGGGAVVGALTAMRGVDRRGSLWGMCVGGIMAGMLLASGFLLYNDVDIAWGTGITVACMGRGGATGILFGNGNKRRKG